MGSSPSRAVHPADEEASKTKPPKSPKIKGTKTELAKKLARAQQRCADLELALATYQEFSPESAVTVESAATMIIPIFLRTPVPLAARLQGSIS